MVQARPVLEKVMRCAYAQMATHRLILCLDKEQSLFAYRRLAVSTISTSAFNEALSTFVNQAEEYLHLLRADRP